MITREMVESIGISYPARFRLDLIKDPFPWFLLSVLFGARIPETIAVRTFYMLRRDGLLSPESIIGRGWEGLVSLLDSGGYTRYDFKTATKLLELSNSIISQGSLNSINQKSNSYVLAGNLKSLAKGIGDVTVGIFLREMVGIWEKATPLPSPLVKAAARMLGIDPLSLAKEIGVSYGMMESFLVNVGKKCFRSNCKKCIFPEECEKFLKDNRNPVSYH